MTASLVGQAGPDQRPAARRRRDRARAGSDRFSTTPTQADLLRSTADFCEGRVAPDSIYGVLHRECFNLFPDEMFADLFTDVGRRSVPPMIVAVVMVLQRIEGLSDREAVERFAFDARWKYAAGGLDFDYPGFVHTVLVDMRARLAARTGRIGSSRSATMWEPSLFSLGEGHGRRGDLGMRSACVPTGVRRAEWLHSASRNRRDPSRAPE
jgi:Transposase domain (DUF772)